jgi:hypothetical protein
MKLKNTLIPFAKFTLIAYLLLTPQRASCQFSESTIREINERLLELHECRQKQTLYKVLADNDGKLIHRQDSIINVLTNQNTKLTKTKSTYQTISAVLTLVSIALIL